MRKSFVYIAFGAVTLLGIALLTAFPAQPSKASQPGVQTAVGAPQIVCLSQDGSRGNMFLSTKATPGAKQRLLRAHPNATLIETVDKAGAVKNYWVCLSRNSEAGILSLRASQARVEAQNMTLRQ